MLRLIHRRHPSHLKCCVCSTDTTHPVYLLLTRLATSRHPPQSRLMSRSNIGIHPGIEPSSPKVGVEGTASDNRLFLRCRDEEVMTVWMEALQQEPQEKDRRPDAVTPTLGPKRFSSKRLSATGGRQSSSIRKRPCKSPPQHPPRQQCTVQLPPINHSTTILRSPSSR